MSKNLDGMSLEELVRILKVHELKLLQDGSIKKEKSIALKVVKRTPTQRRRVLLSELMNLAKSPTMKKTP